MKNDGAAGGSGRPRTWVGVARRTDAGVEVDGPLSAWDPEGFDRARLLLLSGSTVQGWVELSAAEVGEAALSALIAEPSPPVGPPGPRPSLVVAVCTRDRPDDLDRCLARLAPSLGPSDSVLVVDNAPTGSETEAVVRRWQKEMALDRVVEPRPGLSRARNAALRSLSCEIVAFTDDDALVDPHWLAGIRQGFSRSPDVVLVTGLVPAATLETDSQWYFDSVIGWSTKLTPQRYTLKDRPTYELPFFPYSAGHFGTGANMAVRRGTILDLGGFDEALGAGTRSRGGEDLEMFVRVLRAGYSLAFEPDSIVWHVHREDMAALARQMFGYGSGLTAYFTRLMLEPNRGDILRQLAKSRRSTVANPLRARRQLPPSLLAREALGMLAGPYCYLRQRLDRHS